MKDVHVFDMSDPKSHPRRLCASLCVRPKKRKEGTHAFALNIPKCHSEKPMCVPFFAQYQNSEKNKIMCRICIKTEIYLNRPKTHRFRHMVFLSVITKKVSIEYHAQPSTGTQLPT